MTYILCCGEQGEGGEPWVRVITIVTVTHHTSQSSNHNSMQNLGRVRSFYDSVYLL